MSDDATDDTTTDETAWPLIGPPFAHDNGDDGEWEPDEVEGFAHASEEEDDDAEA